MGASKEGERERDTVKMDCGEAASGGGGDALIWDSEVPGMESSAIAHSHQLRELV